jgi:pheromone shutdown protein TraB
MSLPETVTVLDCPNGSKVFLVGTAHFSKESIEDVRKTIRQIKPQVVLLELCPRRQLLLKMSEEDIQREGSDLTWDKVRAFMRNEGTITGITHAAFVKMSANIMEKLGVAPGGEFRAGFEEAIRVKSTVLLGDRDISITLRRGVNSLPLWYQVKFFFLLTYLAVFDFDITLEEIEKMKNIDMVQMLTGELASSLPGISEVFVNERDVYLTHSLMAAAKCSSSPYGGPVNVVGVVGMGHIPGIKECWLKEESRDVRRLTTILPPHWSCRLAFGLSIWMLQSLLAVGLYWVGQKGYTFISNRIPLSLNPETICSCIYGLRTLL